MGTTSRILAACLGLAAVGGGCRGAEERQANDPPSADQAATSSPTGSGAGGEGAGSSAAGGEGGGVAPCDQWAGPFGHDTDDTIDPNQAWEGFAPGSNDVVTVGLEDYALCGGNADTRAIVVYIDALWCSVCRSVASDLAAKYEGEWKARGVEVITLVVEDADGNPATLESAWQWRSTYGLEDTNVLVDGAYQLANDFPRTLPQAIIVDPITMRIVERPIGKVDLDPILDKLLADE